MAIAIISTIISVAEHDLTIRGATQAVEDSADSANAARDSSNAIGLPMQ